MSVMGCMNCLSVFSRVRLPEKLNSPRGMYGRSNLDSVRRLHDELMQPSRVSPPTPPLQTASRDLAEKPSFVAKAPQLIQSALIANPLSPTKNGGSASPQKPVWFGNRRVSLNTGKSFLPPPSVNNGAHRLPEVAQDKGISGRGGEPAAGGDGRREWESPMKTEIKVFPGSTVEVGDDHDSRLKELEEYRVHKSRFQGLRKPLMHQDGGEGEGASPRAGNRGADDAGSPCRQENLQLVLASASTPKPFSPAGSSSNAAHWGEGAGAMRHGEESVPSTPGVLSLQHPFEEPRARSATIAGSHQPQQQLQEHGQQEQRQQQWGGLQQANGPPVRVSTLFSHYHRSGGSSPVPPSAENQGIEAADMADLRLHDGVGIDARDDQARLFGVPSFEGVASEEPAPSLPWTSGEWRRET